VYAQPSLEEGFGISVIEAMACLARRGGAPMNVLTAALLRCATCGRGGLEVHPFDGDERRVVEGALTCSCGAWHRVEGRIADLMPPALRDAERTSAFARRHGLPADDGTRALSTNLREQLEHFAGYVDEYERLIVGSPYHAVQDALKFEPWLERELRAGALVLEIGCGTGRQTTALARRGIRSLGVDVSEVMLARARDKVRAMGREELVDLVLGTAERPPVLLDTFDACVINGTLHHVDDPERALREAVARVRSGGKLFVLDNHASPVRPLFDWLMHRFPLYEEHAHEDRRFSERQLLTWMRDAGVTGRAELTTFLPPHAWYAVRGASGRALLRLTDVAARIPLLRRLAGIVIVTGTKRGAARPPA